MVLELALKWAVPFVLGGLSTMLVRQFRQVRALKLGLRALLRDRLVQAYNQYMDKGYCPIYARENIQGLYQQYERLGGNGTIGGLMEKLRGLPTDEREGKR